MYLGIEIGGTKIQAGVAERAGTTFAEIDRWSVESALGAEGIRTELSRRVPKLLRRFLVRRMGVGFGGPINSRTGRCAKSHHVAGWEDFPLTAWCQERFSLPCVAANDCDVAGLAEALHGAGKGCSRVFYVTVGTGIGGGFILDGKIYPGEGIAAAEIGHLRPGLDADTPERIVEAQASGWGIAAQARQRLQQTPKSHEAQDLLDRADGEMDRLNAKLIGQAAHDGNSLAQEILTQGTRTLGWAIAQMATLLAPQAVVVGGGVSLLPEEWFWTPLRRFVEIYAFPPLRDTFELLPAMLGEEVVLHGAVALAESN